MKYADVGKEYWAILNHAKFDVEAGLKVGLENMFKRDYKTWRLDQGFFGVSVCYASAERQIEYFTMPVIVEAIEKYIQDNDLALFMQVIMEHTEDKVQKQIFVYKPKQTKYELTELYDTWAEKLESIEDMKLSDKKEAEVPDVGCRMVWWNLNNDKYSRKSVEKHCKEYFKR